MLLMLKPLLRLSRYLKYQIATSKHYSKKNKQRKIQVNPILNNLKLLHRYSGFQKFTPLQLSLFIDETNTAKTSQDESATLSIYTDRELSSQGS